MYKSFLRRVGNPLLSVFAVFCILAAVSSAFAQVTTGNLQGVVADPNGSVVAGATVRISNPSTGFTRETTTNSDGIYAFTSLQPAENYVLEVSGTGFAPNRTEGVVIRIGSINSANVALTVGSTGATVNVVNSDTAVLQTDQNQLSQTYSTQQLTQLPINGGAIETFALLTPGVVTPGDADFSNGVGISANGNRGRSNNFQIDGQDNNDNSVAGPSLSITNVDAIGEVQVITNNFSAEFGRNSGAQINAVTKSGTNAFHGSLFSFFNNSALNTSSNLDKKQNTELTFLANNGLPQFAGLAKRHKDPFGNARFGFSAGGPIIKDKAFFFASYQGDYTRGESFSSGLNTNQLAFTNQSASLAASLFPNAATAALTSTSVAGGPGFAQGVGQVFITPPTIDTNGDGLVDAFANGSATFTPGIFVCSVAITTGACPTANIVPLNFGEVSRVVPNRAGEDQLITREDFNITDKDLLTVRYIFDDARNPLATGSFNAGAIFDVPSRNNNLGVTYTRSISSKFTNEARFNFSRLNVTFGDTTSLTGPRIQFSGTRAVSAGLSSLSFGTANNLPQSRKVDVYQAQDTLISTIGNHTAKFGVDIRHQAVNNFFLPNFLGVFTFAGGSPTGTFRTNVIPGIAQNTSQTINATAGVLPAGTIFNFGQGAVAGSNDCLDLNGNGICDTDRVPGPTPNSTVLREQRGTIIPSTGVFIPAGQPIPVGTSRAGFTATAFENFLLGRPRTINFARGNPNILTSQNDFFFFAQDDYRIRPDLTLNLGVRYEVSTTPFNPIIERVNTRESDPSTAIFNTAFPLSDRTTTKLPIDKNNFAPRLGFAYTPTFFKGLSNFFENRQTVIRGGFGLTYDPSFFNIVLNTVTAAPFAASGAVNQTPGATGSLAFPSLPTTTAQLNTTPGTNGGNPRLFNQTRVSPDFHNPYSINYNFGIQQELFKNSVLEVRYVGTLIRDQFQTINANPSTRFLNNAAQCLGLAPGAFSNGLVAGAAAASTASACSNGGFNSVAPAVNPVTGFTEVTTGNGRVDPTTGNVRLRNNGANGRYDALQARYDQRFGNFLILNANYTFSKTLDNASEIFSTGGGGQGVATAQRFFDTTSGERGLSAFHQKHNFTTNFVIESPFYKDQKGFLGKALGGFEVSSVIRLGSGRPYTPIEFYGTYDPNFENAFVGLGSLRPFNGSTSAPNGTIAFGYDAACNVLFGGPECDNAQPGNFIIYNTLSAGSIGTVVADGAAAQQQARLIYNDFGLANQFSRPLSSLEGFSYFKTPFGDVGRNTFFGNNFYVVNLALVKTTRFNERYSMEFRAEAQNLFNERNFGVPDAVTEDAANGVTVSSFQNPGFNAGSVRQLRFGLRFIF